MLEQILSELKKSDVKLVAVSKTKPIEQILDFYHKGVLCFGENRALELRDKHEELPKDIEWHMIGHLQRNKVKYIAPFVHLIHSVDSLKLLKEINKQALKHDRVIPCLLEIKIGEEFAKAGLNREEAIELLEDESYSSLKNIRIDGLMGMASFTYDEDQVREEFKSLKQTFNYLKSYYFAGEDHFKEISMGMSGDYKIAVEEGSTMVRIGSLIFGHR